LVVVVVVGSLLFWHSQLVLHAQLAPLPRHILSDHLREMVRMVRVNEAVLSDINTVSDLSYGWELIRDFVSDMHERIRSDAKSVQPLRALFLKLASVLDVPLVRIAQSGSRDTASVAHYYSGVSVLCGRYDESGG
jgi:hypothetical protein